MLVNNAGIQNWGNIADSGFYAKSKSGVSINFLAHAHFTTLFMSLPSQTTVINVTSGLALVPFSKVQIYCGTKVFVRSFTLSLRHILKPKGVEVIEMIPPAINTDLGGKGIHEGLPTVSEFVDSIFQQMKEVKTEVTFGSSETRAKANNETIPSYFNKLNPAPLG